MCPVSTPLLLPIFADSLPRALPAGAVRFAALCRSAGLEAQTFVTDDGVAVVEAWRRSPSVFAIRARWSPGSLGALVYRTVTPSGLLVPEAFGITTATALVKEL